MPKPLSVLGPRGGEAGEDIPVPEGPSLEKMLPELHMSLRNLSTLDSSSRNLLEPYLDNRQPRAYERIVWVIAGLRDKHGVLPGSCLHEMMRANIYHDLCAWVDLRVQLLLQLPESLQKRLVNKAQMNVWRYRPSIPFRRDSDPSCWFSLLDLFGKTAQTLQDRVIFNARKALSQLENSIPWKRGSS